MTFAKFNRREMIFLGVVCFSGVSFGYYTFFYRQQESNLARTEKQIVLIEAKIKELKEAAELANIVAEEEKDLLSKEMSQLREEINKIEKYVAMSRPGAEMLGKLTVLPSEIGAELVSAKPLRVKREDQYERLPIAVKLRADYFNSGKYVEWLERLSDTLLIEFLELSLGEDYPLVDSQITLSTYVLE